MAERFRTIVADPPWPYPKGCVALGPGHGVLRRQQPLPYRTMTVEEIKRLPIQSLAASDCRVFLWATNRYLPDAFQVLKQWGLVYRQTLVWHKPAVNLLGSVAPNSAEFVLVATQGKPERLEPLSSAVVSAPRVGEHSQKPDVWLDHIERVSPAPRIELFARRARFGWDYWGDESFETVELGAAS